jgi:hypothetical protein
MNEKTSSNGESRTNFQTEKKWSDQFIPRIRQIVGPKLLRPSTLKEDAEEATDLIMLKAEGIRIACRVRREGFAERYGNEITITCRRETGHECEYDKMILGGMADWFFYAHAPLLLPRFLIDLEKARPIVIDLVNRGIVKEQGPNKDRVGRRCWFFAVHVSTISKAIIARNILT